MGRGKMLIGTFDESSLNGAGVVGVGAVRDLLRSYRDALHRAENPQNRRQR